MFTHYMGKCCLMPWVRVEQEIQGIGGGEVMKRCVYVCGCVCVSVWMYVGVLM